MKRANVLSAILASVVLISIPTANARQINTKPTTSTNPYSAQSGQTTNSSSHFPDDKSGVDQSVHDRMEEQAAKARNSERFKRIQSDTEKLLKLSTELKEDVDKSTKNEMSLDVIRKAAEVEKLAHDVKERMKG